MELRRFRLRLNPASPFGTPPTSGTVFGHLAWAIRRREGRDALRALLARLAQDPILVSDLLPADHLPRPLLAAETSADAAPERTKALKRRRYVGLDAWRALRTGATAAALERALSNNGAIAPDPPFLALGGVPHNRIDRETGKTPEAGGGGLWFADELWPVPAREGNRAVEADLYIRSSMPAQRLESLLAEIGESGFGRDATYGRGRFDVAGSESIPWLEEAPRGLGRPRLLSLSQGVITANMLEARWRRFVLFGKLGREMTAEGRRPWKLPLMLAEAGATFSPADDGPFGAWVTGLHQDDDPADPVGHNGFHLALPFTESA